MIGTFSPFSYLLVTPFFPLFLLALSITIPLFVARLHPSLLSSHDTLHNPTPSTTITRIPFITTIAFVAPTLSTIAKRMPASMSTPASHKTVMDPSLPHLSFPNAVETLHPCHWWRFSMEVGGIWSRRHVEAFDRSGFVEEYLICPNSRRRGS